MLRSDPTTTGQVTAAITCGLANGMDTLLLPSFKDVRQQRQEQLSK